MGAPQGPGPSPDELTEVMARYVPAELRMAAGMPGDSYKRFSRVDRWWALMLQQGLISEGTYARGRQGLFSYTQEIPSLSRPDVIKGISEMTNPNAILTMLSQAHGAKKLGDQVVPIMKTDIPGMDTRSFMETVQSPLFKQEMSLEGGLEILELLAARQIDEVGLENDDLKDLMKAGRQYAKLLKKLKIYPELGGEETPDQIMEAKAQERVMREQVVAPAQPPKRATADVDVEWFECTHSPKECKKFLANAVAYFSGRIRCPSCMRVCTFKKPEPVVQKAPSNGVLGDPFE